MTNITDSINDLDQKPKINIKYLINDSKHQLPSNKE